MFPKCVEGKCCPKGSREGAGDSDIDGIDALFGPPYLIDGKCVENTCEMQLKYDHDATGDIVRPELPVEGCPAALSEMAASGNPGDPSKLGCIPDVHSPPPDGPRNCATEIVEQGGKQCMRTQGGGKIHTKICQTGGWEIKRLMITTCEFDYAGDCAFDHLSEDGKAASGQLYGGALIAVIVVPIIVFLICCIGLIVFLSWCCCCRKATKKPPAADASGVEVKTGV